MLENPKWGWGPTAALTESNPDGFLKFRNIYIRQNQIGVSRGQAIWHDPDVTQVCKVLLLK